MVDDNLQADSCGLVDFHTLPGVEIVDICAECEFIQLRLWVEPGTEAAENAAVRARIAHLIQREGVGDVVFVVVGWRIRGAFGSIQTLLLHLHIAGKLACAENAEQNELSVRIVKLRLDVRLHSSCDKQATMRHASN